MYFLVLALAVVGANASNQTECIRSVSQNITEKLEETVRIHINRAYVGGNNFTQQTLDIINNTSSLVVSNVTAALQPLVNSNTSAAVIANSARVIAIVSSQYPGWVLLLTRLGNKIGSDGGVFFARGIASLAYRDVNRAIRKLRPAILNCLEKH